LQNARVIGQHVIAVRFVAKEPHYRGVCALGDLHDASFGAAIRTPVFDACEHVIAMHRIMDCIWRDEEIAVHVGDRMIRNHEAVAIAMRNKPTRDEIWSGNSRGRWCALRNVCGASMFRSSLWQATLAIGGNLFCRQSIASCANFLNFAATFQVLQYARKITAPAMLEGHSMRNMTDTRRLFQSRKISEYISVTRFFGTLIVTPFFVLVFQSDVLATTGYRNLRLIVKTTTRMSITRADRLIAAAHSRMLRWFLYDDQRRCQAPHRCPLSHEERAGDRRSSENPSLPKGCANGGRRCGSDSARFAFQRAEDVICDIRRACFVGQSSGCGPLSFPHCTACEGGCSGSRPRAHRFWFARAVLCRRQASAGDLLRHSEPQRLSRRHLITRHS